MYRADKVQRRTIALQVEQPSTLNDMSKHQPQTQTDCGFRCELGLPWPYSLQDVLALASSLSSQGCAS